VTNKISRSQWGQIHSRVHSASYTFDPKWKCLIDGKKFMSDDCPHTAEDQQEIIAEVIKRETVNA